MDTIFSFLRKICGQAKLLFDPHTDLPQAREHITFDNSEKLPTQQNTPPTEIKHCTSDNSAKVQCVQSNIIPFHSVSQNTDSCQHSVYHQLPNIDGHLQQIVTSALLFRQQISPLFQQTRASRIVPKKIKGRKMHDPFEGASSYSTIFKGIAPLNQYAFFQIEVTLDRSKKLLSIQMSQRKTVSKAITKKHDDPKYLDEHLSKVISIASKLYWVLDRHNDAQPRPWTQLENRGNQKQYSLVPSQIISGILLNKTCFYPDMCNISIEFKDYRLGNAIKSPFRPKITVLIEH